MIAASASSSIWSMPHRGRALGVSGRRYLSRSRTSRSRSPRSYELHPVQQRWDRRKAVRRRDEEHVERSGTSGSGRACCSARGRGPRGGRLPDLPVRDGGPIRPVEDEDRVFARRFIPWMIHGAIRRRSAGAADLRLSLTAETGSDAPDQASAMLRPRLVFPVPGGPAKRRIEPCFSSLSFMTARCWTIRSLTFSKPLWLLSSTRRASSISMLFFSTVQGRSSRRSR